MKDAETVRCITLGLTFGAGIGIILGATLDDIDMGVSLSLGAAFGLVGGILFSVLKEK